MPASVQEQHTWSAPRLQGVNKFFKAQAPQALHFERLFLISAAKAAHHY